MVARLALTSNASDTLSGRSRFYILSLVVVRGKAAGISAYVRA